MKKIAILIENLFNAHELIYPYHRLREDYEVHLIGSEADTEYKSEDGVKIKSTHASKDVNYADYEGIYIPGGYSPDKMRGNENTVALVKDFAKAEKPIAAICHGGWMLASCVDLAGKKVTSVPNIKDDLIHAGAEWVDEEVVVMENIVTSRTPKDLPAHVKAFVDVLEK